MAWLEVGKWMFMGGYMGLESATIVSLAFCSPFARFVIGLVLEWVGVGRGVRVL